MGWLNSTHLKQVIHNIQCSCHLEGKKNKQSVRQWQHSEQVHFWDHCHLSSHFFIIKLSMSDLLSTVCFPHLWFRTEKNVKTNGHKTALTGTAHQLGNPTRSATIYCCQMCDAGVFKITVYIASGHFIMLVDVHTSGSALWLEVKDVRVPLYTQKAYLSQTSVLLI